MTQKSAIALQPFGLVPEASLRPHTGVAALQHCLPVSMLTVRQPGSNWWHHVSRFRLQLTVPVPTAALTVRWTEADDAAWAAALAANGSAAVATTLHRGGIPTRLADALCAAADIDGRVSDSPVYTSDRVRDWSLCVSEWAAV